MTENKRSVLSDRHSDIENSLDRGIVVMEQLRALGDVLINSYRLEGSINEALADLMSEKIGEAQSHFFEALVALGPVHPAEGLPF